MVKKESVIKRRGYKQKYDERKVYASIYAAALSCHYGERKSEKIAERVTKKINSWVKTKTNITSSEIRDQILKNIKDEDVELMYRHHLDLS